MMTNSQFALFIADGGYEKLEWWSEEGKSWLESEDVKQPALWQSGKWNAPNQPVVGVSFWEAEAFCRWAGGRLPTEREWEAAARGPQGDEYPWGDVWEDGICNSSEAGLEQTSAVGLFPRASTRAFPGLEDMAGNVWEWCEVEESGSGSRVIRGGGWLLNARGCRSADRHGDDPGGRSDYLGFRPSRPSP